MLRYKPVVFPKFLLSRFSRSRWKDRESTKIPTFSSPTYEILRNRVITWIDRFGGEKGGKNIVIVLLPRPPKNSFSSPVVVDAMPAKESHFARRKDDTTREEGMFRPRWDWSTDYPGPLTRGKEARRVLGKTDASVSDSFVPRREIIIRGDIILELGTKVDGTGRKIRLWRRGMDR